MPERSGSPAGDKQGRESSVVPFGVLLARTLRLTSERSGWADQRWRTGSGAAAQLATRRAVDGW